MVWLLDMLAEKLGVAATDALTVLLGDILPVEIGLSEELLVRLGVPIAVTLDEML